MSIDTCIFYGAALCIKYHYKKIHRIYVLNNLFLVDYIQLENAIIYYSNLQDSSVLVSLIRMSFNTLNHSTSVIA